MSKVDAVVMINEGEAAIISNPNNLKISIMNYDSINEKEALPIFDEFIEDINVYNFYNQDLGDVSDNYHIDKAGIPYKEQGNI